MPKVSVIILTKNRAELLKKALASVQAQTFSDFEIVVINDGSTDDTSEVLSAFGEKGLKIINHEISAGITASRQEALEKSAGEYIAVLDDDDEWMDGEKLKKQINFLESHPEVVLVGGGIRAESGIRNYELRMRPETDPKIRKSMLIKNNFFTSTVMFRKSSALLAGGFIKDRDDFGEDYDLWLRLGKLGKMYNFQEAFANYRVPNYNRARVKAFLAKQLRLIYREKAYYPNSLMAKIVMYLRLLF